MEVAGFASLSVTAAVLRRLRVREVCVDPPGSRKDGGFSPLTMPLRRGRPLQPIQSSPSAHTLGVQSPPLVSQTGPRYYPRRDAITDARRTPRLSVDLASPGAWDRERDTLS